MKKIYLIHAWGADSEGETYVWLKKELEKKGAKVFVFDMPNTNNPKIGEWVKYLEDNISQYEMGRDTYFVGHSIGCQTIMRFLDKLPKQMEIGGCAFIAPWFNLKDTAYEREEEEAIAEPWINNKMNYERIKRHTKNFLAIFSDDDPCVSIDDAKLFKERLGAKIIIQKKKGHFLTVKEFEEAGKEVLKFIGK